MLYSSRSEPSGCGNASAYAPRYFTTIPSIRSAPLFTNDAAGGAGRPKKAPPKQSARSSRALPSTPLPTPVFTPFTAEFTVPLRSFGLPAVCPCTPMPPLRLSPHTPKPSGFPSAPLPKRLCPITPVPPRLSGEFPPMKLPPLCPDATIPVPAGPRCVVPSTHSHATRMPVGFALTHGLVTPPGKNCLSVAL